MAFTIISQVMAGCIFNINQSKIYSDILNDFLFAQWTL